jgi:hypothetical protein
VVVDEWTASPIAEGLLVKRRSDATARSLGRHTGMENGDRNTLAWGEEEDTAEETEKDIGEQPTLRWLRVAPNVDEPAPATLRFGSGASRVT